MTEFLPLLLIIIFISLPFRIMKAAVKKEQQRSQNRPAPSRAAQPDNKAHGAAATEPVRTAAGPSGSTLQPTVSVSRHDHSDMYAGSMNAWTGEGLEIMDHDHGLEEGHEMPSEHSDRAINASIAAHERENAYEEETGEPLFDGNSLIKAVIMQEVLKRPADRERERSLGL